MADVTVKSGQLQQQQQQLMRDQKEDEEEWTTRTPKLNPQ